MNDDVTALEFVQQFIPDKTRALAFIRKINQTQTKITHWYTRPADTCTLRDIETAVEFCRFPSRLHFPNNADDFLAEWHFRSNAGTAVRRRLKREAKKAAKAAKRQRINHAQH